jgi:hypothetical protein
VQRPSHERSSGTPSLLSDLNRVNVRFVSCANPLFRDCQSINEVRVAFVLDTISVAPLGYVAAAELNINGMLIDSPPPFADLQAAK